MPCRRVEKQCGTSHAAAPEDCPKRLDHVEQKEAEVPPAASRCGSQPTEAPRSNIALEWFTSQQVWYLSEVTELPGLSPALEGAEHKVQDVPEVA
eukprot:11619348-Alexandrium_andersonii.AAC.1